MAPQFDFFVLFFNCTPNISLFPSIAAPQVGEKRLLQSGLLALWRQDPEKVEKWDTELQPIPGFGSDPVVRGSFGLKTFRRRIPVNSYCKY